MPYTLTVANEDRRDTVVDALRRAADLKTKVARKAAGDLADDKSGGKDVRGPAVRVAMLLAEADYLTRAADAFADAPETGGVLPLPVTTDADGKTILGAPATVDASQVAAAMGVTDADVAAAVAAAGDDGTSPEAQRIAALAGLTASGPDIAEDPETNELPEDRVDAIAGTVPDALGALEAEEAKS